MTSWNFLNFGHKVPYEATHNQVSVPTYAPSSLLTCSYSPRYNTVKKPVSVTIWKHDDTWELELTCPKECIANDIAEDQRKQNDNTNTSTVHKLASDEFNLTTTHLVIPYSDDEVKIRLVALLSACKLLQLMLCMLRTILDIWRLYLISAATSMNQSGYCIQLDTDSNRLPSNIWQRLLSNIIVNTHSKYGQLVSMRTLPTNSQNSGGLRKNLFHEQRVTPLPLPDGGQTRHCPMSGTVEQLNRTTYNAKDNKLSAITSSTDSKRDKPTITTHYAVPVIRALQECGSEINLTSPIRSVRPGGIATSTSFILAQYVASPDRGPSPPTKHCVFVYTNTNTRPSYTLEVCHIALSLYANSQPFLSASHDGESESSAGDSGRQRSSDSTSSNSSQRSRPSGRRPLGNRHHPYANSQGKDDDDDDDGNQKPTKQRITSQCEGNTAPHEESKSNKKKTRVSLPNKLDSLGVISPIHRPNSSLMSETSFFKLWGYAKNWVAGNSDTTYTEVVLDETDHSALSATSESGHSKYTPVVSPVAEDPPAIVVHTPKKESHKVNCDEFTTPSTKHNEHQIDAYFTGLGNPEITPVSRVTTRSMKLNLKSYLNAIPLSPQQRVQNRLRTKSQSTSQTRRDAGDSNRTRRVSEGDVISTTDQSTSTFTGRLQYKRRQIKATGTHECDGNTFHIYDSLIEDFGICKVSLETEIKAALQGISPQITPGQTKLSTTEIFWRPSSIEETLEPESHSCSPNCANTGSIDSLKSLLSVMNHNLTRSANYPVNFNGLRIVYSYDRTTRVPLKGLMKSMGGWPFAILHIGTKRDLSLTPLRFNPATEVTEVCDVCIDNYSFLTMPPDSTENLHIFFAPESSTTGTKSDQQVFIIPFNEDLPDQKVEEMDAPSDHNLSETPLVADDEQVKSTEPDGLKQNSTESRKDPAETEIASENNYHTVDYIHPNEEAYDEEGKSAQSIEDLKLDGGGGPSPLMSINVQCHPLFSRIGLGH